MARTSMAHMKSLLLIVILAPILCLGCGDGDDEKKTVQGLREENNVLREQIAHLESREQQLLRDYTGRLDDAKSEKAGVQLRLSQVQKENDELKAALELDERLVSHSGNALLYSLFVSCLLNVALMGWAVWDWYTRRRVWLGMNQFVTARIGRYVETGGAGDG